jgi:hypothetical protein
LLIKGKRLRPRQIEGILQAIAPMLHVDFDNVDNQRLYGIAQHNRYATRGTPGGVIGGK